MRTIRNSSIIVFAILCVSLSATQSTIANDGLAGHWDGTWQSCRSGHRGTLQATFCRIDSNHVQANFTGTFAKIIPFRYRPTLDIVHEQPGMIVLQGSKRLPLMGNFEYRATVTGNQFEATYRSRRDHGVWRMRR